MRAPYSDPTHLKFLSLFLHCGKALLQALAGRLQNRAYRAAVLWADVERSNPHQRLGRLGGGNPDFCRGRLQEPLVLNPSAQKRFGNSAIQSEGPGRRPKPLETRLEAKTFATNNLYFFLELRYLCALKGFVGAAAVDRRYFRPHRSKIRHQLPAVMDAMVIGHPQERD